MTSNLTLAVVIGVLVACGVVLIMERGIVRSFLGVMLMSNGVNLLFMVASGKAGLPPIIGTVPVEQMSDPLPQAMVLTAIVITLALTGFVLALSHRWWQVTSTDIIVDDDEDARIVKMAAENDMSDSDFVDDEDTPDEGDDPDPGGHHPSASQVAAEARASTPTGSVYAASPEGEV
ncbi:MAG: Na(+)/H(+) antiporter subunit C [Dermatophilus congolensis]|nr:Na(+)/H(+) antiporter subunit C [Dermatophilus congolensis]